VSAKRAASSTAYPFFVRRDVDGFFGLMIDNLLNLLLIMVLCRGLCGIPAEIVTGRILPGAAVSILLGNLFYAWQARRLARRERRRDVAALPYGINTVSLIAFVFLVMKPGFDAKLGAGASARDAGVWAWQLGVLACVVSGIVEFVGAFFAERLRRITPRAALLAPLAGIAIVFLGAMFVFRIYTAPLVAILPMAIILAQYFGRVRFPKGLPGGLVAIAVGAAVAWILTLFRVGPMDAGKVAEAARGLSLSWPGFFGEDALTALRLGGAQAISVAVLMGLMSALGSLQNIESAAAAGDRYNTTSSLAADGVGSLAAGLLGSCFPTTIYIGHPGWKGLGARAGYSTLNGLFVAAICLTGAVGLIGALIPLEAGLPILLWIGLMITAQAYRATPSEHAPAVAIGLIPALAGFAFTVVQMALPSAGKALVDINTAPAPFSEFPGILALNEGYLYTSFLLAAITVHLIDRRFRRAAWWSAAAAALALTGVIHGTRVTGNVAATVLGPSRSYPFAIGYALMAGLFFAIDLWTRRQVSGDARPTQTGEDLIPATDDFPIAGDTEAAEEGGAFQITPEEEEDGPEAGT